MKGTFKIKDNTVTIEEFSYPLSEFLIDEPKFKTPKVDELFYHRGHGTFLFKNGDQTEDSKAYPADDMEVYIGRKDMYRGAYKARRKNNKNITLPQDKADKPKKEKSEELVDPVADETPADPVPTPEKQEAPQQESKKSKPNKQKEVKDGNN